MNVRQPLTFLFKLIAMAVYDTLVIAGILFFLALLAVILTPAHEVPPETLWFQLLVVGGITAYLAGSLKMGGQTLGMRAWRLQWNGLQQRPWAVAIAAVIAGIALVLAAVISLFRLMGH